MNLKTIKITRVSNGYVVEVVREGNQTPYDETKVYIAEDKLDLVNIIGEQS